MSYIVFFFFSPFSIAIISLVEERANFSAFRTFAQFALVWSVSSSSCCLGRAAVCDLTFSLHIVYGKYKKSLIV